jgi:hypothetical protein
MPDPEGPKIIVDTDWKSQAQAEKEKLVAADKAKSPAPKPASPGAPPSTHAGADEQPMPQASFEELVRMLATQALLYLGAFPDPETGRRMVSLELAQFNIDMLSMVEERTKGNLSEEEKTLLTRMLYELRIQFVEISKAVAKAVEQGRVGPGGVIAGGGGGGAVPTPSINIRPPTRP